MAPFANRRGYNKALCQCCALARSTQLFSGAKNDPILMSQARAVCLEVLLVFVSRF